MARLNLTIDEKLLDEFREKANKKFNFKKGAIKRAVEEALHDWLSCEEAEKPIGRDTLKSSVRRKNVSSQ